MTYAPRLLAKNPTGYWRLGGSTNLDSSGNGHTGTFPAGGTIQVFPGILDNDPEGCISSNTSLGAPGVVPYGAWLDTDYLSVIILVKPRLFTPVPDSWIWGRDHAGGDSELAWRLDVVSQLFNFRLRVGGTTYVLTSTTTAVQDGEYSLGASYDGTTARLYINGVEEASQAISGVLAKPTTPLNMASSGTNTVRFTGHLDEASVFDYALTAGDFAEMHTEVHTPTIDVELTGTVQTATARTSFAVVRAPAPAYLAILDPALDRAPTTAQVVMANLAPLAEVTFTIGATVVGNAVADIDGEVAVTSVVVDRPLGVGTHVLTGTTSTQAASANFTLARNPSNFPVHQTEDADPVLIAEALGDNGVYKWVLQDLMPGGLGSWVMPINPASMSNPHVRKNVGAVHTTALNGRHHVYEGARPLEWEFAGFVPDQAYQSQLIAYSELPRRFYLIDHRNRAWIVAFSDLDIRPRKRVRDDHGIDSDWLADYTARVVLYSQQPRVPVGA